MLTVLVLFVLFGMTTSQTCKWIEDVSDVKTNMKLHKTGFHRELEVMTTIASKSRFMECDLLYRLMIPAGAYIDMDSVNNSMTQHTVYPTVTFDIEAPRDVSESKAVFLHSKKVHRKVFLIENTFLLPVHLRYHSAVENGGYADIFFEAPDVFVKCSKNDELFSQCKPSHKFPCDATSRKMCAWTRISKNGAKTTVSGSMPRGDSNFLIFVAIVTFSVIFIGVAFLVAPIKRNKDKRD